MRITFLQLIIVLSVVGCTLAKDGKAQAVLKTKISINESNIELKSVLSKLEEDYEVNFVYSPQFIDVKQKVNVFSQLRPMAEVLTKVLSPLNLTYEASGDVIVIRNLKTKIVSASQEALVSVTGKVVDEKTGIPLPGVTVKVKGTNTATATNPTGIYTINVPNEEAVLVFSIIGYDEIEKPVGAARIINVVLKEKQNNLNEVVVVGYGTQKRGNVTGAIASANLDDFRDAPNTNLIQSLQGTVPGLNIGASTTAGATPSIFIRGRNTINGSTNVLIILDGIQYNNSLSSINPDDILTVDVLKDASSTAVYGAQAANGVMLITSRKGTNGAKPRISFSTSYATQTPYGNIRPMNRDEYLEHVRTLNWQTAYLAPTYTEPNPAFNLASKVDASERDGSGNLLPNDFDWYKASTKTGFINDNQLSVSGGTDKFNYLISGAFTNQQGFIINDLFKRKSLRVNLESKMTDWMKIGVQAFGSFVNQDGSEPTLSGIFVQAPLLTPFDATGKLIPFPFNTIDANPFMTYYVNDFDRHAYYFANIYTEINFPFLKGLSYRLNFGNTARNDAHYFASVYAAGQTGEAYKNNEAYYDYTLDNILNYNKTFGKHSVTGTLVYGSVERKDDYTSADATGFTRLTLGYNDLVQGTKQVTSSTGYTEALNYQMARVNYAYNGRYLFTGTVRRDGFSGFAANYKYAIFPSVSVGWVLSDESFMKKVSWLDYSKIRLTYGVSGNQTARYSSLDQVSVQQAYIFGDGGTTALGQFNSTLGNPNLKWEKTREVNAGLDFTLLKGRLSGSIDLYDRHTKDLLFDVTIPTITGFSSIRSNVGEIGNRGAELALTSKNIDNRNLKWTSTISVSRNVNRIISLLGSGDLIANGLFIGHPISSIYDYKSNGIYQVGETTPAGYTTGGYRVVDYNGDRAITTADRSVLGSGDPAYRFSILNKFDYKNFTLSFFLNSIQGGINGYLGNNSNSLLLSDNTIRWNYVSTIDYWSPKNPNGEYPMFAVSPTLNPGAYRDRSFVRLQDVTLAYKINNSFTKKLGMKNFSVYVSGKNLKTWTKWKGWDPETGNGLNGGGRPILVGYAAGVNVTF